MAVTAAFRDYVLEQLNRLVPTVARALFGGAGLYSGGFIFGLLDNDTLYFKVDDANRPAFEAAGCAPFRPFGPDTKPMGYFEVPADAIEDPEALRPWLAGAMAAAQAAKARGGARTKRPKPTRATSRSLKEEPMPLPSPKRKRSPAPPRSTPARPPGGISDAAVEKATGRDWAAWLKLLDAAGCRTMSHREIVAVVTAKDDVGPWWRQMVAVGYEQARGLRAVHQKLDGFSANVSRTVGVPLADLYRAWAEAPRRRSWLPPVAVTVTSTTPNRSMRLEARDIDGTVRVEFRAKDEARSVVQVQHDRLARAGDVPTMKTLWGAALDRLKARLEARR